MRLFHAVGPADVELAHGRVSQPKVQDERIARAEAGACFDLLQEGTAVAQFQRHPRPNRIAVDGAAADELDGDAAVVAGVPRVVV